MKRNSSLVPHEHSSVVKSLCLLVLLSGFMVCASPVWAANYYVRAGAAGNGSGSDWNNACTDLAGTCDTRSLVRGDTYYIAAGTYRAQWNIRTPASGSSLITIKRATVADHGTDTGWQNSYDGQATFIYDGSSGEGFASIETSYVTIDGVTGPGSGAGGNNPANYGFFVTAPPCSTSLHQWWNINNSSRVVAVQTNVTLSHTALVGCGPALDKAEIAVNVGCGACSLANSTITYNYIANVEAHIGGSNWRNVTIDHNWPEKGWSTPAHHGEIIAASATANNIVRPNIFKNCRGTACIAALDGITVGIDNWEIYGNLFIDGQGGNCVIATGTSASIVISNTKIYNNTVMNSGTFFFPCGG